VVQGIYKTLFPTPRHLKRRQVRLHDLTPVRESLQRHYHKGWRSPAHYSKAGYDRDLHDHVIGRLDSDRRMIVPWLDHAKPLRDSRVLEIGCGTGSSTVAVAEQGAAVVGIDIDCDALLVAQDRCHAYGIAAEFHAVNVTAMTRTFGSQQFDFIIFFASLEHMTVPERLTALRDSWAMLPKGGQLVIVETPNRLWYYDGHTSLLPFFHWLPDELAFHYSQFSPRENFRELYRECEPDAVKHFFRQGRGVSFHEFDLTIGPALNVVSSLSTFHGLRYKPQRSLFERRYKSVLRQIYPDLHEGFCEDTLFLIIEKD
jgi:S-adenosylmethionine-dependent methyltransferase